MLRKAVSRKAKLATEAPINGGPNYEGPKVETRDWKLETRN